MHFVFFISTKKHHKMQRHPEDVRDGLELRKMAFEEIPRRATAEGVSHEEVPN